MTDVTGAEKGEKAQGRWVPWMLVLFFAVIALLDGIFVTIAIRTGPGTVTEKPYETGLAYNEVIAEADRERALGWQTSIDLVGDDLLVALSDAAQKPIEGAEVRATALRPVQEGYDFDLVLQEQASGLYKAKAHFPLPGQWKVRIFVKWQDTQYQFSKTVMAP